MSQVDCTQRRAYAVFSWFGWSAPHAVAGPFATEREANAAARDMRRRGTFGDEAVWVEQIDNPAYPDPETDRALSDGLDDYYSGPLDEEDDNRRRQYTDPTFCDQERGQYYGPRSMVDDITGELIELKRFCEWCGDIATASGYCDRCNHWTPNTIQTGDKLHLHGPRALIVREVHPGFVMASPAANRTMTERINHHLILAHIPAEPDDATTCSRCGSGLDADADRPAGYCMTCDVGFRLTMTGADGADGLTIPDFPERSHAVLAGQAALRALDCYTGYRIDAQAVTE